MFIYNIKIICYNRKRSTLGPIGKKNLNRIQINTKQKNKYYRLDQFPATNNSVEKQNWIIGGQSSIPPTNMLQAKQMVNQRIANHLGQEYPQNSNFLPNCKRVNIAFANTRPFHPKRDKSLPYHIKSLRQYTDNCDMTALIDVKRTIERSRQHKIKRYYTQEKNSSVNDCKGTIRYLQTQKATLLKPPQHNETISLKVVSNQRKARDASEQLLSKGKLYEEISRLCNIRCSFNSKLTLMKRTYNLKKLQKILH